MDIVLSPTYAQDRLMYAYVSTPSDNRVICVADDDIPKPILTGIPKGATGNMGALIFTSPTTLVVLTGDAGNPAQAADPGSLAGKVLRIEQPTTVDQAPQTTALTGMEQPAACASTLPTARCTSPTAPRPLTACSASRRTPRSTRCGPGPTVPGRPAAPRSTAPCWSTWSRPNRRSRFASRRKPRGHR